MSAPRIKRRLIAKVRQEKKAWRDYLKASNPTVTVVLDEKRKVVAVGANRETLAQWLEKKGIESFEMVDYSVVL